MIVVIDDEEDDLLCLLEHLLCRKRKRRKKHFNLTVEVKTKERKMLEIKITNEQKVKVTLAPVTSAGKPAQLDGTPTWEKSSGDSTMEVAADGLSASLISSDTPGESMFVVSADADLGAGVENITDSIKLTVEGAKAINLGLVAGAPENK